MRILLIVPFLFLMLAYSALAGDVIFHKSFTTCRGVSKTVDVTSNCAGRHVHVEKTLCSGQKITVDVQRGRFGCAGRGFSKTVTVE